MKFLIRAAWKDVGPAVLVFLIACSSMLMAAASVSLQQRTEQFEAQQHRLAQNLGDLSLTAMHLLDATAAAYQSFDAFDAARLAALSGTLMSARKAFDLMVYASWVDENQRTSFVAAMRDSGYPGFHIKAKGFHTLVAGQRGNLAIRMIEPYSPRYLSLLGQDLLRTPDLVAQFEQALRLGITGVINHQPLGPRKTPGLYFARATYRGLFVPPSVGERLMQGDGFFVLRVDLPRLLDHLRTQFPTLGISLVEQEGSVHRHYQAGTWSEPVYVSAVQMLPGKGYGLSIRRALFWSDLISVAAIYLALLSGMVAVVLHHMYLFRRRAQAQFRLKERAIQEERKRAQGTLQSLSDAVLVTDEEGQVLYLNPVAERLLKPGRMLPDTRLSALMQFVDGRSNEVLDDTERYLDDLARGRKLPDVMLVTPDEGLVAVDNRMSRLSADGYGGWVMVMRDVRLERELNERLEFQATHDMLTGLWNRSAFERRAQLAIDEVNRGGGSHALLFIDLDRFKLVNDTSGHQAGDHLLGMVAELLRAGVREGDMVARIGGDEFAVLLVDRELNAAADVATRLRRSMENLHFMWSGTAHEVHASFGVVPLVCGVADLVDIMAHADLACHAAKEAGRNTVHVYEPDDQVVTERRQEMQWLPRLQDALERNQFVLYRQCMRSTKDTDAVPICEFLLRLRGDEGVIAPGLFLPSAERYDMMRQIDSWVIAKAFQAMADPIRMPPPSVCTINLSGQSLSDLRLFDEIVEHAGRCEVAPQRVCFEITETAAISNMSTAIELIARLRAEGYRIMLDDFGAGMSSFGYLSKLGIDFIKIDGQFVCDVVDDPLAATMIRMICEMAKVLGVQTVAEKIESQDVLDKVAEMGVDYVQGYLIEHPKPLPSTHGMQHTA